MEWLEEEVQAFLTQKQEEAIQELKAAFTKNGIDSKVADVFAVQARNMGPSSDRSIPLSCSIQFTSPNGIVMFSKAEVIKRAKSFVQQDPQSNLKSSNNFREEIHASQRKAVDAVRSALPLEVGDKIMLVSLGEIRQERDAPEFHNMVQLYPVGYKCQMPVPNLRSLDGHTTLFEFEIRDVDGGPEFVAKHCGNGQCQRASTEEGLFKKLEALAGHGGPAWGHKSFFNLEIELLLEGMPGAIDCVEYKFHEERGFPHLYNTQDALVENRAALLANSARERRKSRRDAIKLLSPDEQKRAEMLEKKRLQEEKDAAKLEATADKDRKKMEAEAQKRQKEALAADTKKAREQAKKEKEERDTRQKKDDKEKKERNKAEEKYRNIYRRGVKAEVKQLRNEAQLAVLAQFDREEGADLDMVAAEALQRAHYLWERNGAAKLEQVISKLPTCESALLNDVSGASASASGASKKIVWDAAVHVANSLYLSRQDLGLHFPCTLENIVRSLDAMSSTGNIDVTGSGSGSGAVGEGKTGSTPDKSDLSILHEIETGATALMQYQAQVDQINLVLVRALSEPLHALVDLKEKQIDPEGGERGGVKKTMRTIIRLPLNQLTWPEMARMVLVMHCFGQLRGDPAAAASFETQFAVRGGRGPIWRSNKNVIRRIRYRWYMRARVHTSPPLLQSKAESGKEDPRANWSGESAYDQLLACHGADELAISLIPASQLPAEARAFLAQPPLDTMQAYANEADVVDPLTRMSTGVDACSPAYRRCASVLVRLLQTSPAKHFIWEISQDVMEGYFDIIRRPLMLANVATHLLTRAYDSDGSLAYSEEVICSIFYEEMQSVFRNCFTFNTEIQSIVYYAQRAQYCFFRHMHRWVLSAQRPSIENCNENSCLLSQRSLDSLTLMRCGHCCGCYHLDALAEEYLNGNIYVVPVSQELVDNNQGEWACPFCMQEDSTALKDKHVKTASVVNEFGPSILFPWQLNPKLSSEAKELVDLSPGMEVCLDALILLSNASTTNIRPTSRARDSRTVDEDRDIAAMDAVASDLRLWTLQERLTVLHALVLCLAASPKHTKRMDFLYEEVEKLKLIAAQAIFKEGEFLRVSADLVGDQGALQCQAMLDEIAGDKVIRRNLATRVFDGRCCRCKGSTFDDDQAPESEDEEDGGDKKSSKKKNQVILCDGCNAETHLRCTDLTAVPNSDYYCDDCQARKDAREPSGDNSAFDNFEAYRDRATEDDLCNRKIDRLAALEGHNVLTTDAPSDPELDTSRLQCAYCSMFESDICSPMVILQSKEEHDQHVLTCVSSREAVTSSGQKLTFVVGGKKVKPPPPSVAYFPHYTSSDAAELIERARSLGSYSEQSSLAVHQLCALEMYRARCSRNRNVLRRKRRKVVEAAVAMSGVVVRPLGYDARGREYWKFPCSNALYVCGGRYGAGEKMAFADLLRRQRGSAQADKDSLTSQTEKFQWHALQDTEEILGLANMMGPSPAEQALRSALISAFPLKPLVSIAPTAMEVIDSTTSEEDPPKASEPVATAPAPSIPESPSAVSPRISARAAQQAADALEAQLAAERAVEAALRADQTPVSLCLVDGKGSKVETVVEIPEEVAFCDKGEDDDDEEHGREFMSFGRKYYVVSLLNSVGRKVRPPKGSVTVTCQVHMTGTNLPLASTPLTEPYQDGMYYFSTAVFHRSGEFTISFVVEGLNARNIEPLVYSIKVTSRVTKGGPAEALSKLEANAWMSGLHRRTLHPRIRRSALIAKTGRTFNEFESVRAALLAVFAALPEGCLPLVFEEERRSKAKATVPEPRNEDLTEALGWTEEVELMWYTTVTGAVHPVQLMEAALILEYYISKKWWTALGPKLLAALPITHSAIRGATLAAVALRVFAIDRSMLYDKFVEAPRSKRSDQRSSSAGQTKRYDTKEQEVAKERSSNRKRRPMSIDEDDFDQDELAKAMTASLRQERQKKHSRVIMSSSDESDGGNGRNASDEEYAEEEEQQEDIMLISSTKLDESLEDEESGFSDSRDSDMN